MIFLYIKNSIILAGLEVFPVMAMFLFLLIFIGVIIYAFSADKKNMDNWSNMPLEDDESLNQEKK
ncbi:MAG: cbb3-type cytochrome c oxidase subunit 3 [Bacteroidota bacterium]|nr:cbb3-type cytochrome c oxidase subunit 3 [Bacteroidota bacterium]